MNSYICCEECWDNENRLRPATWVYTMDKKTCEPALITPGACNLMDWTTYICDEHKKTAEEFAEHIGVPDDCDDFYEYFEMEEICQIKVADKVADDDTYEITKRIVARY